MAKRSNPAGLVGGLLRSLGALLPENGEPGCRLSDRPAQDASVAVSFDVISAAACNIPLAAEMT